MNREAANMKQNRRLLPIDAIRGTAMFFVGISHISYYILWSAPHLSALLRALGFFATPNFLLMSGLACGYQLARVGTTTAAWRIVDRGLFVLLVGHFLVAGSIAYIVPPGTTFEHIVITDSIGLILCTAPLLRRVPSRRLLEAGAALFVASSTIGQLWRPTTMAGAAIAGPLFGIDVRLLPDTGWISATLPLAGLFLIGAGIGKLINRRSERPGVGTWHPLLISGAAAIALAVALNVTRHFIQHPPHGHFDLSTWDDAWLALLDVRRKVPPTPAYALFYGGIGIALVGLIGLARGGLERLASVPATVGRASFISYVSLQWMVDFTPRCLGFDAVLASPALALAYLLSIALIMFLVARTWDRHGGNRLLTVGLRGPDKVPRSPSGRHRRMLTGLRNSP
jgi:uncharacterized membrane protein